MNDRNSKPRVAFQGDRGAFSEEAAVILLGPEAEAVPCPTFDALFSSIHRGAADFALAPVENSLAGSVHRSYDLLLESNLHIIAETVHRIVHNLIVVPGARMGDITTVASHPVALAQCENFLRDHPNIKRVPAEDTAGSVLDIMERADRQRSAIASRRAANIYHAEVLREGIEDHRENYTRFVLLAANPAVGPSAGKLSIVLQLEHRPGALHQALEVFARRSIDLVKIESRPIPGRPWQYRFYLDLQASLLSPQTQAALEELKTCADEVRVLGCYPVFAAGTPRSESNRGELK